MTVITAHAEVTDLGRWAEGLRGLAQWLADGRPDNVLADEFIRPIGANYRLGRSSGDDGLGRYSRSVGSHQMLSGGLAAAVTR